MLMENQPTTAGKKTERHGMTNRVRSRWIKDAADNNSKHLDTMSGTSAWPSFRADLLKKRMDKGHSIQLKAKRCCHLPRRDEERTIKRGNTGKVNIKVRGTLLRHLHDSYARNRGPAKKESSEKLTPAREVHTGGKGGS